MMSEKRLMQITMQPLDLKQTFIHL